jgi:hypothetical protein
VFGLGGVTSPAGLGIGLAGVVMVGGALVWALARRDLLAERLPGWLGRVPAVGRARAERWVADGLSGLAAAGSPHELAAASVWSLALWSCSWAFYALVWSALPARSLPIELVLTLSLGALAVAPPSAPAAPGIYHAVVIAPLSLTGQPQALLAAFAITAHALQLACMVSLGLWSLAASSRGPHDQALLFGDQDHHQGLVGRSVERDQK